MLAAWMLTNVDGRPDNDTLTGTRPVTRCLDGLTFTNGIITGTPANDAIKL